MKVTIATHNGSAAHRDHNIRNEKVVSKEDHIDPKGVHEIWADEKPREAYDRLFGEAVERYNAKQTREERKITSYYNQIAGSEKQHPVYEMIVGVYSGAHNEGQMLPDEQCKEILKEFCAGWKERNPNLELIGAYYHADEQGEPHVHIDYVPVAHGYTRGLDTQAGLVKALEEQGFSKVGKRTAQMQWQARENEVLDGICKEHGLEVLHPGGGLAHQQTAEYKAKKGLEHAIEQTAELLSAQDEIRASTADLERSRDRANEQAVKAAERAARELKRTAKKDKDMSDKVWVDKSLLDQVMDQVREMKADAQTVAHTNHDIENAYEEAKQSSERAKRLENYKESELSNLQAERSRYEDKTARLEQEIDRRVNLRLDQAREQGRQQGIEEVKSQMQQLKTNDGRDMWQIYQAGWDALCKQRAKSFHRDWDLNR